MISNFVRSLAGCGWWEDDFYAWRRSPPRKPDSWPGEPTVCRLPSDIQLLLFLWTKHWLTCHMDPLLYYHPKKTQYKQHHLNNTFKCFLFDTTLTIVYFQKRCSVQKVKVLNQRHKWNDTINSKGKAITTNEGQNATGHEGKLRAKGKPQTNTLLKDGCYSFLWLHFRWLIAEIL